jgi:hypothetical protein
VFTLPEQSEVVIMYVMLTQPLVLTTNGQYSSDHEIAQLCTCAIRILLSGHVNSLFMLIITIFLNAVPLPNMGEAKCDLAAPLKYCQQEAAWDITLC